MTNNNARIELFAVNDYNKTISFVPAHYECWKWSYLKSALYLYCTGEQTMQSFLTLYKAMKIYKSTIALITFGSFIL